MWPTPLVPPHYFKLEIDEVRTQIGTELEQLKGCAAVPCSSLSACNCSYNSLYIIHVIVCKDINVKPFHFITVLEQGLKMD